MSDPNEKKKGGIHDMTKYKETTGVCFCTEEEGTRGSF
jgi:hypothetical protein